MVAKWSQSPKKMGHRFYRYPIDFIVVRPAGIEPAAYCLGGRLCWLCHNLRCLVAVYKMAFGVVFCIVSIYDYI